MPWAVKKFRPANAIATANAIGSKGKEGKKEGRKGRKGGRKEGREGGRSKELYNHCLKAKLGLNFCTLDSRLVLLGTSGAQCAGGKTHIKASFCAILKKKGERCFYL